MTIRVDKNNAMHKEMERIAKEMLSDKSNLILAARGPENRKDYITPCCIIDDVVFYVAADREDTDYAVFPSKLQDGDYEIALKNTADRARIVNVSSVNQDKKKWMRNMPSVYDWEPEDGDLPMWILTTENGVNGAGILACDDVLMNVWSKIGDYYLIPSSIHELLVVPLSCTGMTIDDATAMVEIGNRELGLHRDKLVDSAWLFDGKLNTRKH